MKFNKAKFLTRFVSEAKDHINKINDGLVLMEKGALDTETLNQVFRAAHTIKGSSKMLKLVSIGELSHKLEDALDALRQNKIKKSSQMFNLLFKGVDAIDNMLDMVAAGQELQEAPKEICDSLEKIAQGEIENNGLTISQNNQNSKVNHTITKKNKSLSPENQFIPTELSCTQINAKTKHIHDTIRVNVDNLDKLINLMGEIISLNNKSKYILSDIMNIQKKAKKNIYLLENFLDQEFVASQNKEKFLNTANSIFYDLKMLISDFKEDINIYNILTSDLQDKSIKMRMVPLSTIFNGFHKIVRDISKNFQKNISFVIKGSETEIDKKIVEKISDPIIHMIRNSIDHGIETTEQRIKKGKPSDGLIKLSAYYEGENVIIKIEDDGAGINIEKIKEKALKKDLLNKNKLNTVQESDLINMIFMPGFSTSDIITEISGRGVGMDVVKKNIMEDLKGSINVETKQDKGTAFYMKLPLTMAIIHILRVSVSGIVFGIPTNFIDEIIKLEYTKLIDVMGKKAIRVREHIIPLAYLDIILNIPGGSAKKEFINNQEKIILIVSTGSEKLGIIIDSLLDEENMMIKSLPAHMRNIPFVSGCIISGKNEMFNVLHIPKIIEAAKKIKTYTHKHHTEKTQQQSKNILIVDDSISTREIEKSILESYGYCVTVAGDGIEGIEKAKHNNYDLIITDIEMPKLDGFSLTKQLRQDKEYQDTPIILVTSLDKEEDKRKGILVGADAYIIKGDFEQSTLIETIQNLIG